VGTRRAAPGVAALRFGVLLLAVTPALVAAAAPPAAERILGTWRGTSICVDKATDRFCKDERVVYVFQPIEGRRDSVQLEASKIVGGKIELMGVIGLTRDSLTGVWSYEFTSSRGQHARWAYQVRGAALSGTLVDLPSGRLVRRVAVRR
jgi:hypothetical protein